MASPAHCAFCFETLAAHFERRQPLRLKEVEKLWTQFHEPEINADRLEDEDRSEADMIDAKAPSALKSGTHAAISRLVDPKADSSASSSSNPSIRSSPSTSSSTLARESQTTTPASSSTSSRTSLHSSSANQAYPLFVTWNTISKSGRKSLRGCIGTFEAQELEDGLQSYALTSAFEDVRFSPIPASLLSSLSADITLLTNFSSPKKDPMAWELGKHGIRISFTYHGRRYGSTYLPDVAREQGWTKEEALISLMRKAGWNGRSEEWERVWRDSRADLITYEGEQAHLSYADWRSWRDWVNEASR